ncbi:MAG TPA: prepilin-type N-terminal cleavage/methylation domain-containing protein, partial [Nitrospira sp.]|nr:prepilin-type N-terminal cleavage/methylation domain-containing protein [Nitrospira sp.]
MMNRLSRQRCLQDEAGFTLIELMVGLAVGVIVMAAAFSILTMTRKSLQANEQTVDMQQNVRMAMEMMSRDIKLAGFGSPGTAVGNCTNAIVPNDQT